MSAHEDRIKWLRDPANLADYAKTALTIRTKKAEFKTLEFNAAQQLAHERFERQRRVKGLVRALVLKGRQQGISTYVTGRFYQRASLNRGVNVYILSHEQTSTDTLFGIVDRYHRNCPLRPHVGASNAKELEFDKLESSYAVATAGSKGIGRSKALSLFHGSEVALWQNAKDHFAASVQAVPYAHGTEIILESTSGGPKGEFYDRFTDAINGTSDEGYEAIFIPWHMSPEYAIPVGPSFVLRDEPAEDGGFSEREYAELFSLSREQMAWRRMKQGELRDEGLFRREYPSSVQEAWSSAADDKRFVPPALVMRARKNKNRRGAGPLILGIDPASGGGDRFVICARRGSVVPWIRYRDHIDILEAFAWVKQVIDEEDPARVYIDAGNIGVDLITMLRAAGPKYVLIVRAVNFGGKSEFKNATPKLPGPVNRRAEMYGRGRDWLQAPEGATLPDEDAIEADITAPRLKPQLNNDFLLESKKEMASRGVRSPDLADGWVLTFASLEFIERWTEGPGEMAYGNFGHSDYVERDSPQVVDLPAGQYLWMS